MALIPAERYDDDGFASGAVMMRPGWPSRAWGFVDHHDCGYLARLSADRPGTPCRRIRSNEAGIRANVNNVRRYSQRG